MICTIPSCWTKSETVTSASSTVNLKAGDTLTLGYDADCDDCKAALLFNNGIMDIELVWRTNTETEYASIIFTKDEDSSAELQIYPSKVCLVENGNTTDFKLFASYTNLAEAYKFGTDPEDLTNSTKSLRLEICDAPDIEGEKVLKLYVGNTKSYAIPMAMGVIPSDSCLVMNDTDPSDNSITFKNNGTAEDGMDVGRISVATPDENVTKEEFVITKVENLTSKDGGASAKILAYYTTARLAKAQTSDVYQKVTPILAIYDTNGNLCSGSSVSFKSANVYKGAKAEFDLLAESASAKKAKLFIWDDLSNMEPQMASDEVTVE